MHLELQIQTCSEECLPLRDSAFLCATAIARTTRMAVPEPQCGRQSSRGSALRPKSAQEVLRDLEGDFSLQKPKQAPWLISGSHYSHYKFPSLKCLQSKISVISQRIQKQVTNLNPLLQNPQPQAHTPLQASEVPTRRYRKNRRWF